MKNSMKVAALCVVLGGLCGCVNWASYPAGPGEVALKDPNRPMLEELMMTGMKWVVTKYPPVDSSGRHVGNGRIALNLPIGVRPQVYRRVCEAAGGGAEPLTEANSTLPIYHIREFRIRGDQAQMNVVIPASSLGASPQGGPIYQEIKLGFDGGLQPWKVTSFREWGPGAEAPAPNYYVPEPEYKAPADKATPENKPLPAGP